MGKIKVKGNAKKEYEVDLFKIDFIIRARSRVLADTITAGKERTEQFLGIMKDQLGINPDDFVAGDYYVSNYGDEDSPYHYEKGLSVTINSDLALVEKISELLKQMSDITFRIDFELSDESIKETEVLRQAVEDSREKAKLFAASLGQKVVGTEECNYSYEPWKDEDEEARRSRTVNIHCNPAPDEFDMLEMASRLKNPVKTIQKSVNIVWITE